jgi:peptidoglycan/xylan/chitin deacetylase (PgdA/CDA1 family)
MLIPILMYHNIRQDDYRISSGALENAPYVQTISQFKKQIEYIVSKNMSTMSISDLSALVNGSLVLDKKCKPRAVILTFDDGDVSNYEHAFALFSQYQIKATFFVTTDFVGRNDYVSWGQLIEMQAAGMEIGSHSVSHPIPSMLDDRQLSLELTKSKKILEDKLGQEIQSFSSPTGFYNSAVEFLARQAGYLFVCDSRIGYLDTKSFNPFHINRIPIKRSTGFIEFASYMSCDHFLMMKRRMMESFMIRIKTTLGVEKYNAIRKSILKRRNK